MSPTLKMNNGVAIPQLGLGVWKATGVDECYEACIKAFEVGYRHIDTARIYENEKDVGRAIQDSGLDRKDLFITTKLWNDDQGYDSSLRAFEKSLADLRLDYVDLYLIHFPVTKSRQDSWKALERIYSSGRVKAIGVSNYTIPHLEELISKSSVVPVLNQVEFHPFLNQKELLAYCTKKGILIEAYSPLAHGKRMLDPKITAIAEAHKATNAQVMIQWALAKGMVVIPKSTNPQRIHENFQALNLNLSGAEMATLDQLDEGFRTCWDPSGTP